jgi:uncharacterized membrane protein
VQTSLPTTHSAPESAWTVANVVYGLHTLAIVVGVIGSATVIGSFVGSVPSILAVILNYVKRSEARGTWLESHYQWQIRTFWAALAWFVLGWLLFVTVVGILIAIPLFIAITAWVVYRIGRGWLRLRERAPMYA